MEADIYEAKTDGVYLIRSWGFWHHGFLQVNFGVILCFRRWEMDHEVKSQV